MLEIRLRIGSLTNVLINAGAFVLAIKKDPHMATHVSERFAETNRFKDFIYSLQVYPTIPKYKRSEDLRNFDCWREKLVSWHFQMLSRLSIKLLSMKLGKKLGEIMLIVCRCLGGSETA